jgi:hypothetical protein
VHDGNTCRLLFTSRFPIAVNPGSSVAPREAKFRRRNGTDAAGTRAPHGTAFREERLGRVAVYYAAGFLDRRQCVRRITGPDCRMALKGGRPRGSKIHHDRERPKRRHGESDNPKRQREFVVHGGSHWWCADRLPPSAKCISCACAREAFLYPAAQPNTKAATIPIAVPVKTSILCPRPAQAIPVNRIAPNRKRRLKAGGTVGQRGRHFSPTRQ